MAQEIKISKYQPWLLEFNRINEILKQTIDLSIAVQSHPELVADYARALSALFLQFRQVAKERKREVKEMDERLEAFQEHAEAELARMRAFRLYGLGHRFKLKRDVLKEGAKLFLDIMEIRQVCGMGITTRAVMDDFERMARAMRSGGGSKEA
jgi:hypothetical protein